MHCFVRQLAQEQRGRAVRHGRNPIVGVLNGWSRKPRYSFAYEIHNKSRPASCRSVKQAEQLMLLFIASLSFDTSTSLSSRFRPLLKRLRVRFLSSLLASSLKQVKTKVPAITTSNDLLCHPSNFAFFAQVALDFALALASGKVNSSPSCPKQSSCLFRAVLFFKSL